MKIGIVGTGYVGLMTGICFAEMGYDVTCVDIDSDKIQQLKSGESTIFEAGLEMLTQRILREHRLQFTTDCSCPDWSNPCKHIAAVYYLLAEEFDRDPFLLFRLRGMTREELLERIVGTPKDTGDTPAYAEEYVFSSEPVTMDERFWQEGPLPEDLFGVVRIPPAPAALPKRLGTFPFWRSKEHFLEAIESIHKKASRRGLDLYQGADNE